jgi:N-acyl homoserine lactone hydrolase
MSEPRVIPMHVSDVQIPQGDPRAGRPFPIIAHAVVHRDGVFLFDTGLGIGNEEIDRLFSPRTTPINEALMSAGISPADVTGVANCHLHVDHGGQNDRFPGVPIFVQEREWRMVYEPDYTVPQWIDRPELTYELLDGEHEVAPGVRVIPTPGHTPGHQSLVISTQAGTVVLAGQAVQTESEWLGGTDPADTGEPTAADRAAYADSVRRLRALGPIRVHFAHDPVIWERPSS